MTNFYIDNLIRAAVLEDVNYTDVSADNLFGPDHTSEARLIAKEDGVLCGIGVFLRVFELLDPSFTAHCDKKDGEAVSNGEILARLSGNTAAMLKGERTALNLLQHMSGIATQTAAAVRLVEGTKAQITDTRKTLPGLRALQKYAVTCGGGKNHRFNLSDGAMIKDNHIDAGGGIAETVRVLRGKLGHMVKIEVETRNLDEVRQALDAGADILMLDNMSAAMMTEAVKLIGGRALTEASGGITLENLREKAETGVDILSLGALTHSVKALDISMKFIRP